MNLTYKWRGLISLIAIWLAMGVAQGWLVFSTFLVGAFLGALYGFNLAVCASDESQR